MNLEELRKAWEKAVADAKAKPDDEGLKTAVGVALKAYEDAKAAAEDDDDDDEIDESKLDAQSQKLVKKLRDEAAKARVKNKELASKLTMSETQKKAILKAAGIEDDSEKPEEKVKTLTAETQTLAFRNAVLEQAMEHGIPASGVKYFSYLVSEAVAELKEGEELSDEQMAKIVKEAKAKAGKKGNTTFKKDGTEEEPGPGGSSDISLEQFIRMSITEKSALYEKTPDVYKALAAEAKAKRKLV